VHGVGGTAVKCTTARSDPASAGVAVRGDRGRVSRRDASASYHNGSNPAGVKPNNGSSYHVIPDTAVLAGDLTCARHTALASAPVTECSHSGSNLVCVQRPSLAERTHIALAGPGVHSLTGAARQSQSSSVESVNEQRLNLAPAISRSKIAGRLREHAAAWQQAGASAEVMKIITEGYRIPFSCDRGLVPTFRSPRNGLGCLEYKAWLVSTLPELIAVGAIREVAEQPHVTALVNVIPKATPGKYRLIVDLRPLNQFVLERSFSYETHSVFRDVLEDGDDMISFDLESGYYHVDVAVEDQKFLGFELFGKRYVFCVLPFGLRDACYAFTEVCKVPVGRIRALGIRVLPYLDDFLCALQNMSAEIADEARQVFERLGFLINFAKSVTVPTKRIENLGFVVDTRAMTYELTPRRMQKFIAAADTLNRESGKNGLVPARLVARVTGHIAAAALVLERRGRLHTRYLNHSVHGAAANRAWDSLVRLGDGARAELNFWQELLPTLGPAPIRRPVRPAATVRIASDASDFAWGGVVLVAPLGVFDMASTGALPTGVTDGMLSAPLARGTFSDVEAARSSTWRELHGSALVLESFVQAGLRDQVVDLQVDNLGSSFIFANAGSQNRGLDDELDLHPEVLHLEQTAADARLDLMLTWVTRDLNQAADDVSKLVDPYNYALEASIFAELGALFGPFDVDRFSDAKNARLGRFNSRYWSPGTEAVDAFSVSWANVCNWVHPPLPLIARSIGKLRDDRGHGTLLLPRWPSSTWWPMLFPQGRSPVRRVLRINEHPRAFFAFESAARLGHGLRAPWTMLAVAVDFRELPRHI